jgi:hypothetical protein
MAPQLRSLFLPLTIAILHCQLPSPCRAEDWREGTADGKHEVVGGGVERDSKGAPGGTGLSGGQGGHGAIGGGHGSEGSGRGQGSGGGGAETSRERAVRELGNLSAGLGSLLNTMQQERVKIEAKQTLDQAMEKMIETNERETKKRMELLGKALGQALKDPSTNPIKEAIEKGKIAAAAARSVKNTEKAETAVAEAPDVTEKQAELDKLDARIQQVQAAKQAADTLNDFYGRQARAAEASGRSVQSEQHRGEGHGPGGR